MLDGGGWPEQHQSGDGLEVVLYGPLQAPAQVLQRQVGLLRFTPTCFSGLLWEKQETRFRVMDTPGAEKAGEGRWEQWVPAMLWTLTSVPCSLPPPESFNLRSWLRCHLLQETFTDSHPAPFRELVTPPLGFPGGAAGREPTAKAGDIRDVGSILGSGRCPGGGNGNPLQYSCLENPMDRGA